MTQPNRDYDACSRLRAATQDLLDAVEFVLLQMNSTHAILPWPATCREKLEAAVTKVLNA